MLGLSGIGLSEQQLNDLATNTIRTQLATVEGAQTPYPYGGKQRQIQVDIDPKALQAQGLSPADVVNAVSAQNLIVPSGTMKMDRFEYAIETNSAPDGGTVERSSDPDCEWRHHLCARCGTRARWQPTADQHRSRGWQARHHDGDHEDGLGVYAHIINDVQGMIAQRAAAASYRLRWRSMPFPTSRIFVRGAIDGVVREAIIAACLTGVMILVFLGSWRSTLIIAVSIPLSILCSITMLSLLHETINIMTLGGLALAVGILVDDATVEIENINRNLEQGKEIEQAILDGAAQIATPALVSTFAICIVFVPMFLLGGVARYLFVPLAEAVVFAMLASYLLSRTVVPTMAKYLLKEHDDAAAAQAKSRNPFIRFQLASKSVSSWFRHGYVRLLTLCVDYAGVFLIVFFVFALARSVLLVPWLGQDFFPVGGCRPIQNSRARAHRHAYRRNSRSLRPHRWHDSRTYSGERNRHDRRQHRRALSGLNLSYSTSAPIGPEDADIQVQLSEKHHPTDKYVQDFRGALARDYPGVTFYVFQSTSLRRFSILAFLRQSISRSSEPICMATARLQRKCRMTYAT